MCMWWSGFAEFSARFLSIVRLTNNSQCTSYQSDTSCCAGVTGVMSSGAIDVWYLGKWPSVHSDSVHTHVGKSLVSVGVTVVCKNKSIYLSQILAR